MLSEVSLHIVLSYIKSFINICNNLTLFFTEPNAEYKIWAKAFTGKHEGKPSDAVVNKTDIIIPSAPRKLNVTCQSQDTIFIKWERPLTYPDTIDLYYVCIYLNGHLIDNTTVETAVTSLETIVSILKKCIIKYTTPNNSYKLSIRICNVK